MRPEISVVVSTYNRSGSLSAAMESILGQVNAPEYELVIADNGSTDGTAQLVKEYALRSDRVRYVFEPRQGVAYGRNAGVAQSVAPLIAFTDDDVAVSKDWLCAIHASFEENPQFGCIGGKVLPRWPEPPPRWLTRAHWAPLALLDYGDTQALGAENQKCLITANMAMRRTAFEQIGGFDPAFQKSAGLLYALEDRELQERYWRAGGRCLFDPRIQVHAQVQKFRMQKKYHRRWHFHFGEWQALLQEPAIEQSNRSIFGVPGHILRRLASQGLAAVGNILAGRTTAAFERETQAWYFAGFVKMRWMGNRRATPLPRL